MLALLTAPPPGYRVEPVRYTANGYRYARAHALALIGRPELAAVLPDAPAEIGPSDRLLQLAPAAGEAGAAALALRGVAPYQQDEHEQPHDREHDRAH